MAMKYVKPLLDEYGHIECDCGWNGPVPVHLHEGDVLPQVEPYMDHVHL